MHSTVCMQFLDFLAFKMLCILILDPCTITGTNECFIGCTTEDTKHCVPTSVSIFIMILIFSSKNVFSKSNNAAVKTLKLCMK